MQSLAQHSCQALGILTLDAFREMMRRLFIVSQW